MTVSIPESVTAEGNVKALFVPAIASVSTGPTVAELTAGIDVSCYLMPDWDGPSATQNTGEDRRFCSKQTFTRLGRSQWEVSPLIYTYLPQELGTPGDDANEVYETLSPDTAGYLVVAYGFDPADTLAANDVVDIFPIEAGIQVKQARGSDEFAPLTVTQTLAVTGVPTLDKKVVA